MVERTTSTDKVIAGFLWLTVANLYIAAGVLMLLDRWLVAILVAEMACGVSAYAAVRHLRCYHIRVCELLRRVDSHIQGEDARPPLQRIH